MKTKSRLVTLTIAAALTLGLSPAPAAAAASPTKILVNGDSITHAYDGAYSWRYFADKALTDVDFVGPKTGSLIDGDLHGGGYADPDFDQAHAARWGMALWEMIDHQDFTSGNPGNWSPNIGDLVAEFQPDIVVEQLGINDLIWGCASPAVMDSRLRTYIAQVRSAKPDTNIVLGSIPQTWATSGDCSVVGYNTSLPILAQELSTQESTILV